MTIRKSDVPTAVVEKFKSLLTCLESCESLLVAFSGGVDSTLLLAAAHRVLGNRVVAVTARFEAHPDSETRQAINMAENLGVRHIIHDTNQMSCPAFTANSKDRCYICKTLLFKDLSQLSRKLDLRHIAQGANCDDLADYRPGMRAAEHWRILSPLIAADLGKPEIRLLSRALGLPNWNRPAESCLATRIPYGILITPDNLTAVEMAEAVLHDLGFYCCRVRHHGTVARIEVMPLDFDRLLKKQNREKLIAALRRVGFSHVAMDLEGYVSGSMNQDI